MSDAEKESAQTIERGRPIIGGLIAVGVILLLMVLCVVSVVLNPNPNSPSVNLQAQVRNSATGITVTNGSPHDYEDVTVKINYGLTGEYSAKLKRIPAGATVTVPYFDFTNSSSERFNYSTTKVERVMVRARIGDQYDWEEFSD